MDWPTVFLILGLCLLGLFSTFVLFAAIMAWRAQTLAANMIRENLPLVQNPDGTFGKSPDDSRRFR